MKYKYLILIMFSVACLSQNEIIEISDREAGDYWDFDRAKTGDNLPERPDTDKYGGEIQFKYTYLIDVNGRPRDFKFISAIPKSAEIEQDKLRRRVLFYRYTRNPKSKFRGATFIHADERWWKPDPKTISFPSNK